MTASAIGNTRIFECFRVGKHIAMNGLATQWGIADLDQIVRNYAIQQPAPLCIGHPASDGPAFGEVKELFRKHGVLYAVAKCGDALINMVREGHYKHVSSAFKQGINGWSLRHIGFLGALPPAVKGLAPLQFAELMESVPGSLCFAENTGPQAGLVPALAPFQFPKGWEIDQAALPLFEKCREVQADCPNLSFAECASAVERHIFERR
jgi:hypothetical protein